MKDITCCTTLQIPWYKRKLIIGSGLSLLMLILIPLITQDFNLLLYANTLFAMMWVAILLGLLISGIIDTFIPKIYIEKLLSHSKKRTLLTAALLGTLLSTCSHGVLAISMQLYKKGASIPAVIVLLTASPWANFPMTILLWTFFGKQGLLLIFLAIGISLLTGLIFQKLDTYNLLEKNQENPLPNIASFSILNDLKSRFQRYSWNYQTLARDAHAIIKGSIAISDMVIWWFIIAFVMASFIGYYIPSSIFQTYLSSSVVGLFNTLGIATILEVCSEGSSVLAFELYNQTQSLGNVFVFLLAGVATDYTEIGLLWSTIGKRTAILLPLVSVPIILGVGYFLYVFI
ncbi:hypothetical protein DID74_01440 [Candidatus Marinamargulisbacteria bacterium SCGC AG-333-B06]|nr:hypothetical protein DID74_01440 [Candidatus Marinamargulisbacteria bacterium SCGC AG-333-B06]